LVAWLSRPRSRSSASSLLVIALLSALAFAPPAAPQAREDYCVVVSPDVSITDMTMEELRRIFQFEQRFWRGGGRITVLFSETSLESGSFVLDTLYGSDYPGLKLLILEKLYRGEMELAPKVVASDGSVLDFVESGHGLIAIVTRDSVGDNGVKVLTVDGQRPGSEGYPLR